VKDRRIVKRELSAKEKKNLQFRRNIYKGIVILAAILLLTIVLRLTLAAPLETAGKWAVNSLGYPGIFITVLFIDTFIVPATPDIVIFLAIAGKMNPFWAITLMSTASVIGGNIGYFIGKYLGHLKIIQRILGKNLHRGHYLAQKYGIWTVILAAMTPIPFSTICWLAGILEMNYVYFLPASLFRIPRFIIWYYVIGLGFKGV
jgi:membrane protein YqaA with SNARE-associated domain